MTLPFFAALWVWAAATAGHVALTAAAVRRLAPDARHDHDAFAFAVALGGVGGLAVALHVAATVTGLTLWSGLGALAIWHGALALAARRARPAVDATEPPGAGPGAPGVLALACFAGVLLHWVDAAAAARLVTGADAQGYHVPYAVNLALGASPFDLPATMHLYPMAGSVVGAWFIVPTGDAQLVDLAMCLPFVLLAASVNQLFRLATGLSGLRWSSWLVLALFSTPIFRASSLVSADLWLAAGFTALVAVLTGAWARGWRPWDRAAAGLALGLLVGAKTLGLAAAGLLGATFLVAAGLRRAARHRTPPRPAAAGPWIGALILALGAGGVWLVRNWLAFGSPMAPTGLALFGVEIFPGTPAGTSEYFSVANDLQNPAYRLWSRFSRYAAEWLGPWFLVLLLPALALPVDLAAAFRARRAGAERAARVWLLAVAAGVAAPLVWLLVGAPWTSLDWSRGFSLRYALPVLVLVPLMAAVALFPLAGPWYRRPGRAAVAGTAAALAGLWLFGPRLRGALPEWPVPDLTWSGLLAGLAGLAGLALLLRAAPGRVAAAGLTVAVVAGSGWWAHGAAGAGAHLRAEAAAEEATEREAFDEGRPPFNPLRAVYLAALAGEASDGRGCAGRRFFVLVRIDDPLALQSPEYRNRVYYAGRDVDAARRAGPIGRCDYVVVSRPLLETDKGGALVAALAGGARLGEAAEAGPFVLLRPW